MSNRDTATSAHTREPVSSSTRGVPGSRLQGDLLWVVQQIANATTSDTSGEAKAMSVRREDYEELCVECVLRENLGSTVSQDCPNISKTDATVFRD
jgi:hypothetical protein